MLAAAAAMLAPACQTEGIGDPTISTDVAQAEIDMNGGSTIIYLTSSRDWTVKIDPATSQDDITGFSVTPEENKASRCSTMVLIKAEKNEGYPRAALISFIAGNISTAVTINQNGPVARPAQKLTVAEFLAKPQDGSIWYELTGKISNLTNTTYGNFDLVDDSGKVYVYGLTAAKVDGSNDKSFSSIGLKEGDIVTLKGTRSSYNGVAQVGGPAYYVSHVAGEAPKPGELQQVSVEDFLKAEVSTSQPYQLTGKVANIKMDDKDPTLQNKYGNFDLVDATGSVYVYGLLAEEGGASGKFRELGIKEGDMLTINGYRAAYKDSPQVGNAYLVSHTSSTEVTVADFLAKEKSKTEWYRLTGTIKEIVKAEYGNFYLEDETGYVYVYGLTKAPVTKNDKSFESLGLKAGDKVTIVGTRDRYDNSKVEDQKDQVGGPAYYISHVAAN